MAGDGVRLISTSIVQAPAESSIDGHRRVELNPWDLQLLLLNPSQQGLLFRRPENPTPSFIHNLKTSLSRTLSFFPTLPSRLERTDHDDGTTASFFVACNNAGAQFDHAKADSVSVSDILGADYVPRVVLSFFPFNGINNFEFGAARPLLAVQVTELADGVFVGCTVNHLVADLTSFWHFLNSWSEMARGLDTISRPPLLERLPLSGPVRVPLQQIPMEHVQLDLEDVRVYHFSKERVAELKAEANSEMGVDRISSLQAVLAHLWRSIERARRLGRDEDVYFGLPISVRSRMQQPEEYFGNAIQLALVNLKVGEVVDHGIGHVALEMNKTIRAYTEENIKSNLKSWSENPRLVSASKVKRFIENHLVPVGSPRFKVYDTDLGWGRPVAVRCGGANWSSGQLVLFPGGSQDGSIQVHACLLPQTLDALHKDTEFMDKLTV